MAAQAIPLLEDSDARRESREDTVRIVEYAPFPRAAADHRTRVGFTRDLSGSGMCIGVDDQERVGSMLRIVVRDADGRSMGASIARVVWSRAARDGRHWLGLDLLTQSSHAF